MDDDVVYKQARLEGNGFDETEAGDLSYWEWMFPEREDGSRDVGDNTIMTREAWTKMISAPRERPPLPEWMKALLACDRSQERYSVARDQEAVLGARGYKRPMITKTRQYGSPMIYMVMDEWAGTWVDDTRIDVNQLKDPSYLESVKEKVLELIPAKPEPRRTSSPYFRAIELIAERMGNDYEEWKEGR